MESKLLVIVGPTASGKTERSLEIAHRENGEIISMDSRQVYRHLAIGTAKPKGIWRDGTYHVEGISHHLIDILDPDERFSAADFASRAESLIASIQDSGKRPILVGGTGLYLKALLHGLAPMPVSDPLLREKLMYRAEVEGLTVLHHELTEVDAVAAAGIPVTNRQRLIRALEIYLLTGKPMTTWHREQTRKVPINHDVLWIDPGKDELDRRITRRCEAMIQDGLIEETHTVLKRGFPQTSYAFTGLGYPNVLEHLEGRLSREELLQSLITDTRRYAKRQRTWFRHQIQSRS